MNGLETVQVSEPEDGNSEKTKYSFQSTLLKKSIELSNSLEHQPSGITSGAVKAGIKYPDVYDFTVVKLSKRGPVAGVFTKNRCSSAAVKIDREHLEDGYAQGLAVISKNANVFTPTEREDTEAVLAAVSKEIGIEKRDLMISCTGVIGVPLPVEKVLKAVPELKGTLKPGLTDEVSRAILTTDKGPKVVSVEFEKVKLAGMAKGAGMIEPNMATMLVYFFTNLNLPAAELQQILNWSVERTFNSISVDSDTSTSDTVLLFSSGEVEPTPERISDFRSALSAASLKLARDIVAQAEGASKLIQATVKGASSTLHAKQVAKLIINSPLLKTAIFGADPNWGRIVMAIGKPGQEQMSQIDSSRIKIVIAGITMFEYGHAIPLELKKVSDLIKNRKKIDILVELGEGEGEWTAWGCDLTYEYVKENAEYTT